MDPMASSRLSIMFRICTASHTSKFGVDFLYQVHDENSFRLGAGRIRFRSIEDFLTGTVKDGELLVADPTRDSRGPAIAGFFQDDWRVEAKLNFKLWRSLRV